MEFLLTTIAWVLIIGIGLSVIGFIAWLIYARWIFKKNQKIFKKLNDEFDDFDDLF
ncbi:hypothetical protein AAK938_01390 [Aerococcaceae bacterium 50-4]